MPPRFAILSLALLLSCSFIFSCSHYQWGDGNEELPFETITIAPILNRTILPRAELSLAEQLPRQMARQGKKVTPLPADAPGDALLRVILTDFRRSARVPQTEDTGRGRKFRLELEALVSLQKGSGPSFYFENRRIRAEIETFDEGDPQTSENAAIPLLTEDLARLIIREILHLW